VEQHSIAQLDLRDRASFERFFGGHRAARLLCEHVWEHLTEADSRAAARLCFDFLSPADPGRPIIRPPITSWCMTMRCCAMYLPRPASSWICLNTMMRGRFHYNDWDYASAPIYRSFRGDHRNRNHKLGLSA
jgi:predicted SAM-dependent methyltransferase